MHDCNDTETLAVCILTALTHDITEGKYGDIVRTFKYKTKALKLAIDEAEFLVKEEFGSSFKALFCLVDTLNSKHEKKGYVNAVVKAADFMSLHNFMIREFKRGNREIMPFFKRMIDDLDIMAKENENIVFKTNDRDFEPAKFYNKLLVNANKTLHA
jgi:5'-deoxynucleotidase YfbR-like HD superfamily hydrolase